MARLGIVIGVIFTTIKVNALEIMAQTTVRKSKRILIINFNEGVNGLNKAIKAQRDCFNLLKIMEVILTCVQWL
jgi:hypothetical protein